MIVLTCSRCSARLPMKLRRGHLVDLALEHDPACEFLKALEAGRGAEWERRNGSALRVTKKKDEVSA